MWLKDRSGNQAISRPVLRKMSGPQPQTFYPLQGCGDVHHWIDPASVHPQNQS